MRFFLPRAFRFITQNPSTIWPYYTNVLSESSLKEVEIETDSCSCVKFLYICRIWILTAVVMKCFIYSWFHFSFSKCEVELISSFASCWLPCFTAHAQFIAVASLEVTCHPRQRQIIASKSRSAEIRTNMCQEKSIQVRDLYDFWKDVVS
jgi:hypothetical protein